MAKRSSSFELALGDRNSEKSACSWLYEAIRTKVLTGSLRTGTRLPATRDLARQHGLSRGTVVNAFERLKSEGYIESNVGSGTYVRGVLPETVLHVTVRKTTRPAPVRDRAIAMSDYGKRAKLFPGYENRPVRAFRSNLPALDLFPAELWSQVTARCLRRASTGRALGRQRSAMSRQPFRQPFRPSFRRCRRRTGRGRSGRWTWRSDRKTTANAS